MATLIFLLIAFLSFHGCSNDSCEKQLISEENGYESSLDYDYNNTRANNGRTSLLYVEDEYDEEGYIGNTLPSPSMTTVYDNQGNIYNLYDDGMGNISIYDLKGNHVLGYDDGMGNVFFHDMDGNYYYQHDNGMGNYTMHDMNGNYQYGYADGMGNITIHDMDGNYIHGHDNGMGNITIFEPDGSIDMINYIEW